MQPFTVFLFFLISIVSQNAWASDMYEGKANIGDTVELYLGKHPKYTRSTGPVKHVFRVCNGKNAKTCGYWENTKTKKKVGNAPKTTRKDGVYLVLKNVTEKDAGNYYTDTNYVRLSFWLMV